MSSTAVDAQNAFVELLKNAAAFDDSFVTFGGTGKLPKTTEVVWVMPVSSYRVEHGEQFRIVNFNLVARFEVFRTGEESGGDADARRWELIDAADGELRRKDFHGYASKGGGYAVEQQSLELYDKGWVAESVVHFNTEVWRP